MATFYVDDYPWPKLKIFRLGHEGWKYHNTIPLLPKFPNVGVLTSGKRYDKYTHTLISTERVVSDLIVMERDEGKRSLVLIEQYSVEFRIGSDGKTLIVDPKTRINE